jgi:hypothetical protein
LRKQSFENNLAQTMLLAMLRLVALCFFVGTFIIDGSPVHLCAAVGIACLFTGAFLSNLFARLFLGLGTDKTEPDKVFTNGLSALFILKVMVQGPSLDTILKLLSSRVRRRLYVAHKHWLFFGGETWWVGHPAIAAHAFGISQQKMWRKLSKAETLNLFYMPAGPADQKRKAMLYTGDDDGWKATRSELKPFFTSAIFPYSTIVWIAFVKSICSALP